MSRGRRRKKSNVDGDNIVRSRMIIAFAVVILLFLGLAFRLGWVQIIAADKYVAMAKDRQTQDEILSAKRGSVLDRNGSELASSSTSYKVWLRLRPVKTSSQAQQSDEAKAKQEEQIKEQIEAATKLISETLDIKEKNITEKFDTDAPRVKVASNISKDKVDTIKAYADEHKISVIEIEEGTSRNYPLDTFASHVIGSVNSENNGQSGIELEYNKYLSGVAGRWIKNTDASGNPIPGGEEIKYEKEDGLNVVLTIDEAIQFYVEKAIKKTYKDQSAENVSCIVMDPKTGDILAMASYPNFDLNSPTQPAEKSKKKEYASLSDKKKTEYLNTMWRNPLVSNLYEPGSVFKLVTVGSAIEEGVITPESHVSCSGSYDVYGEDIKCHVYPNAHGDQTVATAVRNSCNPAMMQIVQRMGYDKFYNYLELFGITNKTGIDFPGEALPLIQSKENAGPVGLATMSFGHGLSITPIQMITAVCSYGNDGKMMKPRLVKELCDNKGKAVKSFPTKVVRQVVSKQTTKEMLGIMEGVIKNESTPVVDIPGYRIGAKTGTARKLVNNEYREGLVVGSVLTMAPIENPQFAVLVIVDEPKHGEFGSTTAGPAAESITEEILRYLNIEPSYTASEKEKLKKKKVKVPNVTGLKYSEAKNILSGEDLKCEVSGSGKTDKNFKIVDQYPKSGEYVKKGSTIFLYRE